MRSKNTVGYLTVVKKMPIYKKTPTKKLVQTHNQKNNYPNNTFNNSNISQEYNFLSRYMSKKKYRGVLDMTSPGNKDVLIDSDSEMPDKKGKNLENFGEDNPKKNGCTKLVIEKIESQEPKKNEEYYKFTNQKRLLSKSNTAFFPKKNIVNRNPLLRNTSIKQNKTAQKSLNNNNFESLAQSQILQKPNKPHFLYQDYINDCFKSNYQNCSATNIFNQKNGLKINKRFFNTGFSYDKNKDNSSVTKPSIDYIRVNDDGSINARDISSKIIRNDELYENENSGINSYFQDSSFQNKKHNTKFHYIYKYRNNNVKLNKNISEESKKCSLYDNYLDLIKMNTFSNLSKMNSSNATKVILYPGFNEKLVKIQSAWRGAYVRELMSFYWNLENFKNITNKVINNHLYDYFIEFINKINNCKFKKIQKFSRNGGKNTRKKYELIINDNKDSKMLEEYKKALNQKEEDYENLLKNYNSLVERCTELQQLVNDNKLDNNKNKKMTWKQSNIDSNNNEIKLKDIKNEIIINDANIMEDNKLRKIKVNRNPKLIEVQRTVTIQLNDIIPNNEITSKALNNYYDHFISNLNIINENQFIIEKIQKNNSPLQVSNYELSLINKNIKKKILNRILKIESFDILTKQKQKSAILEISQGEEISLIYNKIENPSTSQIYHSNSINLLSNKTLIRAINIICNNESLSLINNKIIPLQEMHHIDSISLITNKIISLNKINKTESISIINNSEADTNKKKYELFEENQLNSNIEIKGKEKPKTFNNCIIANQDNNIHIQFPKQFNKALISLNNEISILINAVHANKINLIDLLNKENITQFTIEKINKNNDNKILIVVENERFSLDCNKRFDYNIEKRDEIYLNNQKLNIEFIVINDNNLFIENIKKKTCDKITEITEELNRIEPNNHYELIFEGIVNLNEDITNINNNKGQNIIINKQEISYNSKGQIDKEILDNNILNNNKNYNINNEIDKCDGLEINPYEIKRTKNNINNIFISYENKIEMLNCKHAIFTEKAKKNMMKIILPIRLKSTLRDFIRRNTFPLLINNLRKIALSSHFKKAENKKSEIKATFNNYIIYKWNRALYSLCKEFINNKSIILDKIKK